MCYLWTPIGYRTWAVQQHHHILTLGDLKRSKLRPLRFWRPRCRKWPKVGHTCMLLLNINRKPYIWSPFLLVWLYLILVTLKGQCQGHSESKVYICKEAELGHVLLLNTNRKSHMGCPKSPSYLTLSDLVRPSRSDYVVKEPRYSICHLV